MHSYKEIGLVNTKVLFQQAMARHYALPAYNFNNMEHRGGLRRRRGSGNRDVRPRGDRSLRTRDNIISKNSGFGKNRGIGSKKYSCSSTITWS